MNREKLLAEGYNRVERDDRLLDIFPKETPGKGVELWEKWPAPHSSKSEVGDDTIKIIRLWNGKQTEYTFPRQEIELALKENRTLGFTA